MGFSQQTKMCYLEEMMLFVTEMFFTEVLLGGHKTPLWLQRCYPAQIRKKHEDITCYAQKFWFWNIY